MRKFFNRSIRLILLSSYCLLMLQPCSAQQPAERFRTGSMPDWSADAKLPASGHRANIFQLDNDEWQTVVRNGSQHTTQYPFQQTGMLIPIETFKQQLAEPRFGRPFNSIDDLYRWMNLPKYPADASQHDVDFPLPENAKPGDYIGLSYVKRDDWQGLTFGCTACHAGELFGKPIFGLANRYGRGSDFFYFGKMVGRISDMAGIKVSDGNEKIDREGRKMDWVGIKLPTGPGLITSVSQTSLSLSLRNNDRLSSMKGQPDLKALQENPFQIMHAPGKPPALWLAKYKTRWLNDGSQVSGNPVHVNFTWNEIGRAGDMQHLSDWFVGNKQTINELTAAVFATKAPRITDFFPASRIDLKMAKTGQQLFNQHCARCHGKYDKAWDRDDAATLLPVDRMRTTRIRYPKRTKVVDVGTDPNRYLAMQTLAPQLNRLRITTDFGIHYQSQTGYVPPPLEGVWARWPYFHNNSIPTLRDVLNRGERRPEFFFAGNTKDRETDFDFERVGYPTGKAIPKSWKSDPRNRFNTKLPGLGNAGHDEGIFLDEGKEKFRDAEKDSIVEFLKTL